MGARVREQRRGELAVKASTLLKLGRVSNVPTVWSNVLCGFVLARYWDVATLAPLGGREALTLLTLSFAGTLLYVGGMFLNDAFDAQIDARERPERPIPKGEIQQRTVYALGFAQLLAGLVVLAVLGRWLWAEPWRALLAGGVTALLIVLYNAWHKGNAWSSLIMGACRAGLYLVAAFAASPHPATMVFVASGALCVYVVGLTHVARFETGTLVQRGWLLASLYAPVLCVLGSRVGSAVVWCSALVTTVWITFARSLALRKQPGSIGRAVVSLIAGISLVDAIFVAGSGKPWLALLCVFAFGCTLLLQRWVRGT
jgi:hypothetical protein